MGAKLWTCPLALASTWVALHNMYTLLSSQLLTTCVLASFPRQKLEAGTAWERGYLCLVPSVAVSIPIFHFPFPVPTCIFVQFQTTYFFREVAWLSQWTARKLKVQRQDTVVLLVEPCISFSPTSSLGTSPGCSKVMIDWSIAPNFNMCNNSFRTFECDMVYVLSVLVRVWK